MGTTGEERFILTNKRDAAAVVGLKERQFHNIINSENCPGCEAGSYDVRIFVPWFLERAKRQAKSEFVPADDVEAGPNSPMLEKLREERWRRERIKRQAEEGEVLPTVDVHEFLGMLASTIRGFGENFQRQFGPEAGTLHNEMMETVERKAHERWRTPEENRGHRSGDCGIEETAGAEDFEGDVSGHDPGRSVASSAIDERTGRKRRRRRKAKTKPKESSL